MPKPPNHRLLPMQTTCKDCRHFRSHVLKYAGFICEKFSTATTAMSVCDAMDLIGDDDEEDRPS